jgi:hypothetical protein
MDPLVSLYYYAPVCAFMNFAIALFWEVPQMKMAEIYAVGLWTFLANASCAFLLNVSVVFLVGFPQITSIINPLTLKFRLVKPPASSSLSAVSSRISSSFSPPSLSGELSSPAYKSLVTQSPFSECSTTSSARRNSSPSSRKAHAAGPNLAPTSQLPASFLSPVFSSQRSSFSWAVWGAHMHQDTLIPRTISRLLRMPLAAFKRFPVR